MKFYIAYAHHHFADVEDVDLQHYYSSYDEAKRVANEMLVDDDTVAIFAKVNGVLTEIVKKVEDGFTFYYHPVHKNEIE